MTANQAFEKEFIVMLKELVEATHAMRQSVEHVDLLLEEAHRMPLAA